MGPLKTDKGVRLTYALFFELATTADAEPSFTTKQYDYAMNGKFYPSLRRIYMECEDPTEHVFVETVFDGDWGHWEKILKNDVIRTALEYDKWPGELRQRLRSKGMQAMIKAAKTGNANAARWLAEGGWETKRGRPTDAERKRKLREDAELAKEFQSDLERIGFEPE